MCKNILIGEIAYLSQKSSDKRAVIENLLKLCHQNSGNRNSYSCNTPGRGF